MTKLCPKSQRMNISVFVGFEPIISSISLHAHMLLCDYFLLDLLSVQLYLLTALPLSVWLSSYSSRGRVDGSGGYSDSAACFQLSLKYWQSSALCSTGISEHEIHYTSMEMTV